MSIKIIGLTGRTKNWRIAGAGKTTVAVEIQRLTGAMVYGLADPIYNMIKAGFGIDGRSPEWQDRERKIAHIEWLSTGICRDISLRYLLDTIGTDWGREKVCRDLWMIVAERFLKPKQSDRLIVIHDVRFKDEAEWLESIGGVLIHVIRPDYESLDENQDHASNQALLPRDGDYFLINTGSVDQLKKSAGNLINTIFTRTPSDLPVYDVCQNCNRETPMFLETRDGKEFGVYRCPMHGDVVPMRSAVVNPGDPVDLSAA